LYVTSSAGIPADDFYISQQTFFTDTETLPLPNAGLQNPVFDAPVWGIKNRDGNCLF